jgi:hypothetical protein
MLCTLFCVAGLEREAIPVRHNIAREYQYEVVKSLAGASSVGEGKACRLVLPVVSVSAGSFKVGLFRVSFITTHLSRGTKSCY